MRRAERGFTLIELLAVLVIIGILTVLAYPSYTRQLVKARRVQAQLALLETMQQQEQYRALHHTYIAFSIDASDPEARPFRAWLGPSAAASAYELDGQACAAGPIAHCIVLRARPGTANVNRQFADPECGVLTLESSGAQGASGPATRCWP